MGKRKKHSRPELLEPLAGPIIDSHTYLLVHEDKIPGADGLKLSLDEQLFRAKATNTVGVISSACETPSFDPTMQIACAHEGVRVATATYPNEAALHAGIARLSPDGLMPRQAAHHMPLDRAIVKVERLLEDPLVVVIGESGLDYLRTAAQGREAQKRSFVARLELGIEADSSVQVHDRDVRTGALEVLADAARADRLIMFHCFLGDAHLAKASAEKGWYMSFVGPLTYPVNEDLRAILVTMPHELVLAETGVPYLIPVLYRGSPNTPYVTAHTVRFIVELWGVGEEGACVQLMENTRHVCGTW